jgi:phosphoribosylformylglycinamidine synthase
MPQFDAVVTIELKPDILDPAGEATTRVLQQLGYQVEQLRIGRHITLAIQAQDIQEAARLTGEMAQNLLANPIMETYQVQVRAR